MRFLPSAVQKLSSEQTHSQPDRQTGGQTDRQTDSTKIITYCICRWKQVAFQSNANHPLADSVGYIKFEGM